MKSACQYRLYPDPQQKVQLNHWLRTCQYWYNRMLGERFDWWEQNRCAVNVCPLICHLPALKEKPNYYSQKKQLPDIKDDLVLVQHSGELLDFTAPYSTILQNVCKRVEKTFERFVRGDCNGKRSGRPRFKGAARYRTMLFDGADDAWLKFCTINGKWLFMTLPKVGLVQVRRHRPLPEGASLKQVLVTKKADGWYVSLVLSDETVPESTPETIISTWENSLGLDAVLHEDTYLATSEGEKLPSLKPLRRNEAKKAVLQAKKNGRKKGSRRRRKLAKREARLGLSIARSRKDFQYKTAHKLRRTGKKVFFYEKLNLQGLSRRNAPKQDESGGYLPNGQAAKSGLNQSWNDAAFGQFFQILGLVAAKAGAAALEQNPAYTSQLLSDRDAFVFTDCGMREYWDEAEKLWVDRDINAAINLQRVGLDLFPTLKRRKGNPVVVASMTHSTSKEVLTALRGMRSPRCTASVSVG